MGIGAGGHGGSGWRAGNVDGKEGQGLMLSMQTHDQPKPTKTSNHPICTLDNSRSMEEKDQKLTLETGLTPTFGSLGEYMLDLTFELRCLGIIWRTMKEGCDRLVGQCRS